MLRRADNAKLTAEFKPEFDFGQGNGEGAAPVDFSGQEPLGKCPKCGATIPVIPSSPAGR
jgi:DNA topoisomerase-3